MLLLSLDACLSASETCGTSQQQRRQKHHNATLGAGRVGGTNSLVDLCASLGAVLLELLLGVRGGAGEVRLDVGRSLVDVAWEKNLLVSKRRCV